MTALALVRGLFIPKDESQGTYVSRNANCTIRLYYKKRIVHLQDVYLHISKLSGATHYGVNQRNIVMEGFNGKVDDATIALLGVPHECDIYWGYDVKVYKPSKLILEGNCQGLLVLHDGIFHHEVTTGNTNVQRA